MKKYELTNESYGILRRIRALRYIPQYGVKPGDLGGWIRSENNLSQDGNCWVGDNAMISGNARVEGNAWVGENARVNGNAGVGGSARVEGDARVEGNVWVGGSARVRGNARVFGNARVLQNGFINSTQDFLVVGPIGSRSGCTTFYRTVGGIWVCCGCFNRPIEEFQIKVRQTYGDNQYARAYLAAIELAKIQVRVGDAL